MESLEEYVYKLLDEKQSGYLVYHDKAHTQQVVIFCNGNCNKGRY